MSYSIVDATLDELLFIYDHMKPIEQDELHHQGYDRNGFAAHHIHSDVAMVCKYQGVPICGFGVIDSGNAFLSVWLLGTPEMTKNIKMVTRQARLFMGQMGKLFPGQRFAGEVWEKYSTSMKWLELVGFKRTASRYWKNGEPFMLMEWN